MGHITLEQTLIAARPDTTQESAFVRQVMTRIQGDPVIISSVARTMSEQHNIKGGLFMNKLRTLPLTALVALIVGAAALTGGAAYMVYKVVIQPLSVEQTGSVIEDGKNKTTFAVEGCPSYDGVSQEEITTITNAESGISHVEARNYVIARCELNAIMKYAHNSVAAKGIHRYDSSVLSTWVPVVMPMKGVDTIDLDVGLRTITSSTQFYKNGQRVSREDIPEGSLVHLAYDGVASKADTNVLAVMAATVEKKYYATAYDIGGVLQRVPCRNNPSESCLSDLPGKAFYEAISAHTGSVPAEEQRYIDAATNKTYTELGGVLTYIDGNAFTFRTSTGRSVTFHLPEEELKRERAPEQAFPKVGTEIIVTTIGDDRDVVSSSDLLSAYVPLLAN